MVQDGLGMAGGRDHMVQVRKGVVCDDVHLHTLGVRRVWLRDEGVFSFSFLAFLQGERNWGSCDLLLRRIPQSLESPCLKDLTTKLSCNKLNKEMSTPVL